MDNQEQDPTGQSNVNQSPPEQDDASFMADMQILAMRAREISTELNAINASRPGVPDVGFGPNVELAANVNVLTEIMLGLGVISEKAFLKAKNEAQILLMQGVVDNARNAKSSPSGLILPGHG